jgi:hypothetical protein
VSAWNALVSIVSLDTVSTLSSQVLAYNAKHNTLLVAITITALLVVLTSRDYQANKKSGAPTPFLFVVRIMKLVEHGLSLRVVEKIYSTPPFSNLVRGRICDPPFPKSDATFRE